MQNGFNQPTQKRKVKRRGPGGLALFVIILVMGGGAAYRNMNYGEKESPPPQIAAPVTIPVATVATPSPAAIPFVVQTEVFSFVLPATPIVEERTGVVAPGATSTQWVYRPSIGLAVLAVSNDTAVDESSRQAVFDSAITSAATNMRGTVTSDTSSLVDGIYERNIVIDAGGTQVFIKGFGKGTWAVIIMGYGTGAEMPPEFTATVASFVFV